MFIVVRRFKDLNHKGHVYEVGDTYPAEGFTTTKKRIKELSEGKNKYKQVYIKEVNEETVTATETEDAFDNETQEETVGELEKE